MLTFLVPFSAIALVAAAPTSSFSMHDELSPRDNNQIKMSVQVHEYYTDGVGYGTIIQFYDTQGKAFFAPPFVDDWLSQSLFAPTGVPIGGGYSIDLTDGPGIRVWSGDGCVDQTCIPQPDNSPHPGDNPSDTFWLCKFPNPNKC